MAFRTSQEVTRLLHARRNGDESAFDKLTPLARHELPRLAHHYIVRERRGHAADQRLSTRLTWN